MKHFFPLPRLLALCAGLALASGALAQASWPARPITLVVPYPAGGSNDSFARQVGKQLSDALKQPVVIDNKPGASGNIGAAFVAKAPADGYTLLAVSSSFTTNAAVQPRLPFDPLKDFAPVALMAKGPFIVAVNNEFAVRTPRELVAALKAKPGKYSYASSGTGSSNQFATEMLKAATGTFVVHVPYRGMGPAVTDLIGGQTQLLVASGPSLLPHVRAGRIRAIAVTSLQPSPVAPELPPMASAAPGYEFELWWGVLAPAGTPREIVERLNAEIGRIVGTPEIRAAFLREGAIATAIPPARFGALIQSDIARWRQLARQQAIQPE
jgi:tripartite-type tricarboxylate transporter receptor subunit TctC